MTAKDATDTEAFLHEKIPLTRAMGVRVVAQDGDSVVVEAPVALNHNHLHTAFGGSVSAVATLAAYAFLWNRLRARAAELVIAESSIRFIAPVHEVIRAICTPPQAELMAQFARDLAEKGRARVRLQVRVEEAGKSAAEFQGTFVARIETAAPNE